VAKKRKQPSSGSLDRRSFLTSVGVSTGALTAGLLTPVEVAEPAQTAGEGVVGPGPVPVTLHINGQPRRLNLEPRVTLLDALRNQLQLTGAKRVCDRGTCGACTVQIDGNPVYACTVLAIDAEGRDIVTIEGIEPAHGLHPVSAAFVDHDAQQCGFCTPGFVMAVKTFLDKHPNASLETVQRGLAGNICRCGTYKGIREVALRRTQRAAAVEGGNSHGGM
jgi:xanthine dehydrogenase YagT iron-sulfur-binding subunit